MASYFGNRCEGCVGGLRLQHDDGPGHHAILCPPERGVQAQGRRAGVSLLQLGKQLGQASGRDLSDDSAKRVGVALHRTFGMSYGVAASLLARRGVSPLLAGPAMGTAAFVIVDEGTAISSFSSYPIESPIRGVVGHGKFGLVAGLLLSLVTRN